MGRRRWSASPQSLLFQTILSNTVISAWCGSHCKGHTINHHAPFVWASAVCIHNMCVFFTVWAWCRDRGERGAEFDICKLNSAQTWQWWSVVHSSSDCLYLHSCPWVLHQACPIHRPQPQARLAHLLMTALENQIHTRYMFYQTELAGERVGVFSVPLSVFLCDFLPSRFFL